VRVLLTPGQRGDITQAPALIDGYEAGAVLGDKGYDADALVAQIAEAGAVAVIPSKANRIAPREHDRNLYADRNKIERFFNRLKQYRRVATRYEKLGQNYLSVVFLASTLISLL
jgi:transposase